MKYSLRPPLARKMLFILLSILALTLSGWQARLHNSVAQCSGWIVCLPSGSMGWIELAHQLFAAAAALQLFFLLRYAWREQRQNILVLPLTTLLVVLFLGQSFIGALLLTDPLLHLRILHALSTITLWIALLALAWLAGTPLAIAHPGLATLPRRSLKDFLALTKPVIVALLLATTLGGLIAGYRAWPPFTLVLWTCLGGALAAGGSSALNQFIDRDLDKNMQRTSRRPLAAERLTKAEGLAFALALCAASYYILAGLVNLLAALLSLAGIFYYVLIYSIWLKKATVQNIVIGGGAGAIPPMVGWAAATGRLPLAAWILFAIIFMWTPPHFWALAIVRKKDYERAGVPMLPVVKGETETRRQILLYTLALVGVSLLLPALHLAGAIYLVAAILLGGSLLYFAWRVWRVPGNKVAYMMYRWSSIYLLLIFVALVIDALKG